MLIKEAVKFSGKLENIYGADKESSYIFLKNWKIYRVLIKKEDKFSGKLENIYSADKESTKFSGKLENIYGAEEESS